MAGRQAAGHLELPGGACRLASTKQSVGQRQVADGEAGIEVQAPAVRAERLVVASEFAQHVTQQQVGGRP